MTQTTFPSGFPPGLIGGMIGHARPHPPNSLVISPLCRTLIVGMAGRYHLVKEEDGELRPKKDKYSNLCDCLQYGCLSLGEGRRMAGLKPVVDIKPVRIALPRRTLRRVIE